LCGLALALALGSPLGPPAPAWAQAGAGGNNALRLPSLGDAGAEDYLSLAEERRIGEQIMREARRDPDLIDDPVLLEYVQSLWAPLVRAAKARGDIDEELLRQFPWEIFLVRDRSVNAFALPGGYVGVHLGLIAITHNRDQLASVLAHELTHVSQRHIARSIGNARNASLWSVAGLVLAILAASRTNNPDAFNAAIAGSQGLALQGQLNFSRDAEREADRIGFAVFTAAGFAPAGMQQMFERLQGNAAVADTGAYPYLRTHPLTVERISEARNRTLLGATPPPGATLLHSLMQARARVLMDKNPVAMQRYASGESTSGALLDRIAALYGGAVALAELSQGQRAEEMLREAQRLAADALPAEPEAERAMLLAQAHARLVAGDSVGALRLIETLPRSAGVAADAERVLLLARAQAALAWHRRDGAAALPELRRSTEGLQTWVAEHSQDARAWELLAGTAEAIGQPLRSRRALAEARAAVGDLTGAIDRLRSAQSLARQSTGQEFIDASIIDARLRALERERRQLALEARQRSGGGSDRGPDRGP
jgi:predicted Zn-dependent protease